MKALSIKQPWAWLICAGYKDVENRSWYLHMPPLLWSPHYAKNVPMRIYVHAGLKPDIIKDFKFVENLMHIKGEIWEWSEARIEREWIEMWDKLELGAIIGEVTITGCVDKSDSPWFTGPYGFTLADPVLYDKPIPYRGQLGFFEVTLPSSINPPLKVLEFQPQPSESK